MASKLATDVLALHERVREMPRGTERDACIVETASHHLAHAETAVERAFWREARSRVSGTVDPLSPEELRAFRVAGKELAAIWEHLNPSGAARSERMP